MIGLDTNVLVRFIVKDDARQAAAARRLVARAVASGERILLQPIVLCELVWVLDTAYGFSRAEILDVLDRIILAAEFETPSRDEIGLAVEDYRARLGDFADCVVGRLNEIAGAASTYTFDRGLRRHSAFSIVATE